MTSPAKTVSDKLDRFAQAFSIWSALLSSILVLALATFVLALVGLETIAGPLAICASSMTVIAFAVRAARRAGLRRADIAKALVPENQLARLIPIGFALTVAAGLLHMLTWSLVWAFSTDARANLKSLSLDGNVALYLTAWVLLVPIAEEVLFRYGIQRRLVARIRPAAAIFFTSILFSCLHGPWIPEMAVAFLLSAVTGFFAIGGRPAAVPILLHVGWNSSAVLLASGTLVPFDFSYSQ